MSDPDSHDDETTDRTRVRRRMVRGSANPPVEVTEPVLRSGPDATREPRTPRGRSRRRPAVANPFAVERTADPDAESAVGSGLAEEPGVEYDWAGASDDAADGSDVEDDVTVQDEVVDADDVTVEDEVVDVDVEFASDSGAEDEGTEGAAEDSEPARRRRRRGGRGRRGQGGATDGSDAQAEDAAAVEGAVGDDVDRDVDVAAEAAGIEDPVEGEQGDRAGTRRSRGRRGRGGRGRGDRPAEDGAEGAGPEDGDVAGSAKTESGLVDPTRTAPMDGDSDADDSARETAADADDDGADDREDDEDGDGDDGRLGGRRRRRGRRGRGRRTGKTERADEDAPEERSAGSTRLSARSPRSTGGRRRIPTVSPETRRAIAESPPKKMLVTVGVERTQIAVLEERTLVEHYVTQASEASYVGNIYKGRVQNVLPGMEAAFVDIGKGRNGVLYAGEVNYDEADRDGGLPRIEQALKPGQTVMVQVTKDPMGTKGARLTQHLSLAGRYCVLAPGDDMLGISRKLPDDQRERLRKVLKTLKPEGFGLIVRTAAETATAEQLEADVKRLIERWQKVEEKTAAAKVLEPVYAEPSLVLRVIRDVFGPEHTKLVIDDAELVGQVKEYLEEVSPEHVDKVTVHEGEGRLFDAYEVTVQIRRALEKKVWLKSGGYLIIEKTEAMWVIDVNTGKFVGKDNLEETVLRNNIEAAEEIARQLRLRDMGGIIVIDFVDMIVPANRDEVLKRFKRELARDKTKSRVMEISKLGLVQMTRKNVSKGLMESFTEETDDAIPGRRIVEDLLA